MSNKLPILLLAFNRPEHTKKVLDVIRGYQPDYLMVSIDGPREGNSDDKQLCHDVKEIIDSTDWAQSIIKHYSDVNLGCPVAVSQAITAFFERFEEGIILEDDIVPSLDFFKFCEEMLETHRDNEEIMAVTGVNFQSSESGYPYSYYFSKFNHCWGWASWRRAWKHFDYDMSSWPKAKASKSFNDLYSHYAESLYWTNLFDKTYRNEINSWAIRWTFSCWNNGGLTVTPSANLIHNIGFDQSATHTKEAPDRYSPTINSMDYPLKHPDSVTRHIQFDRVTDNIWFSGGPFFPLRRFAKKIVALLSKTTRNR